MRVSILAGWGLLRTCTVRRSQLTTGRKYAPSRGKACAKVLRPGTQGWTGKASVAGERAGGGGGEGSVS